jgi:hypothetical protein
VSGILGALGFPSVVPRISEAQRIGRREASTVPPSQPAAKPATRILVFPGATATISKNGFGILYAWAVDADGVLVPGVTIGFASSNGALVSATAVATDNRTDIARARLASGPTLGSANVTVSSAGLPSVVVAVTVQSTDYGSLNGKPVGYRMDDPILSAEAAAQLAADLGHTALVQEVDDSPTHRLYFLALLQKCQLLGLKVIVQFFSGTRDVLAANGQFSVANWQAQFASFPTASLTPFIPGTLIAHMILGYPKTAAGWGRVITPTELKTMAATSKAALPTLPVIVGGEPARDIGGAGYSAADVDYAFPVFTYGKGPSLALCRTWLDRMKAESLAAGLGGGLFYCGLDIGDGGSGKATAAPPGWTVRGVGQADLFTMSPEEIAQYGTVVGNHASALSVLSYRYLASAEARYFGRADVRKATRDLSAAYARSIAGDPSLVLAVPPTARVGDVIRLDTQGSRTVFGAPAVTFFDLGDGSPLVGPVPPGAEDPSITYQAAGVYTITVELVRTDTGQSMTATSTVTVTAAAGAGGGYYTDIGPVPVDAIPLLSRGRVALSAFGHKVYFLTDGVTLAGECAALNSDNTRIFYIQAGAARVADVTFATDEVRVANIRNVYTDPSSNRGRNDSAVWDRSAPNTLYSVASGGCKFLSVNTATLAPTLLKDLNTDTRFTSVFGTTGRGLAYLRTDSTQVRLLATVIDAATATPVGLIVWEKTGTNALWIYKAPDACAQIVASEARLDSTGRYLKVALTQTPGKAGCSSTNNRSWQSLDLQTSKLSDWVRDGAGSIDDDTGPNLSYSADGVAVKQRALFPAQTPAQALFALPLLRGFGNEYQRGQVSSQAGNGQLAVGYVLATAGLVGPWELYRDAIYRTTWDAELVAKPYRLRPQAVRQGRTSLAAATSLSDLGPGEWFFDGAHLYVQTLTGTPPRTSGTEEILAFDWRFATEEILLVSTAGTLVGRLCHHHHRLLTGDTGPALAASMSYDGSRVVFTSNQGGASANIFCVLTTPG